MKLLNYLELQFAGDYQGRDDDMPEAFNDWFENLHNNDKLNYISDWYSETCKENEVEPFDEYDVVQAFIEEQFNF